MEEDLRLLEVGVHSVGLTATLEETLEQEAVDEGEHDRVGGRDRESGTAWGERHQHAGSEHEEQSRKDKNFGVHFICLTQKI